jgi:hypothetical protein
MRGSESATWRVHRIGLLFTPHGCRERDAADGFLQHRGDQADRLPSSSRATITLALPDEPIGNPDLATSDHMLELIKALTVEGRTVLMMTHESDVFCYAIRQLNVHRSPTERRRPRSSIGQRREAALMPVSR